MGIYSNKDTSHLKNDVPISALKKLLSELEIFTKGHGDYYYLSEETIPFISKNVFFPLTKCSIKIVF